MKLLTTPVVPAAVLVALAVALGLTGPAAASDPTPTPPPTATPTPAPTPTSQPRTVAEASRQARAVPAEGATPTRTPIVISNENLAELAAKGSLTEVTLISDDSGRRPVSGAETGSAGGGTGGATTEEDTKKAYWRGRYAEQKEMIEAIKREIETLDQEIPGLWNQFYAWDDPAYRDGVIKVQLDQKLARRDDLAKQLPEEEAKLPEILNDARQGRRPARVVPRHQVTNRRPVAGPSRDRESLTVCASRTTTTRTRPT